MIAESQIVVERSAATGPEMLLEVVAERAALCEAAIAVARVAAALPQL